VNIGVFLGVVGRRALALGIFLAAAVLIFMYACAKLSMPRNALMYLPKEGVSPSFGSRCRRAVGLELTVAQARAPSGVGGVTATEVLNHAFNEGIQLTPAQATGSPLWKAVQAIGERSLFG
jgi:hypothetical protein